MRVSVYVRACVRECVSACVWCVCVCARAFVRIMVNVFIRVSACISWFHVFNVILTISVSVIPFKTYENVPIIKGQQYIYM